MLEKMNLHGDKFVPLIRVEGKQQGLPKATFILLYISILLLLGVSGNLLAFFGYNYAGEGGNALEKIHPSTFTIILALLAFLSYPNGEEKLGHSLFSLGVFSYLFICFLSIVYTQTVLGQPLSGLIVSWLTPGLLLVLLLQLNSYQIKYLKYLLYGLFFINTLMAIVEYKIGSSLIPSVLIDYTGTGEIVDVSQWGDWRASGIFGHPLISTLVCGLFVVVNFSLICFKQASRLQYFTMIHCLFVLPLFGGRTSIAMALVFIVLMSLVRLWMELVGRGTNYFNVLKIKLVITTVVLAIIVAFQMGMFDQLIDRVQDDNGSSYTRILALEMLIDASNLELIFGDIYKTLSVRQVNYGTIYGIEIFWVGMVLTYGALLSFSLFFFTWRVIGVVVNKCGKIAYWPIAFFFVSISSGVGLVAKNITFSLLMLLIICMYRIDDCNENNN